MDGDELLPETLMDLQIHLDRLSRTSERCRSALRSMRGGGLSPESYRELLDRQLSAQREWEAKNREYFRNSE